MSPLDPGVRRQVEQFVRPLYAGLDGVQTFGQVERLAARIQAIRGDLPVDEELLDLLLLFQGVVDRLGSLAPGGRLDLFLKGLGLGDDLVRRVRTGIGRVREEPRGPEEELVHDALLLEWSGVVATAERLMAAGKKRTPVARALAQLDPGPAPERYRTPRARELGAGRKREAERWIEELRKKITEEGIN
ncbi:MAG TPA: hypothetical protein VN493_04060 [Thermoanaerobaculia bacterium]|nr:hypothetical protein [Thermoanaerobaculia bacterium]